MAIDPARAKSLFLAASELADSAERAAYLDRECGGDPALRARVEALLRANDAAPLATGEFTPEPDEAAPAPIKTTDFRPQVEPGVVIAGRYTLVEKIGEGGMGEVWVAKQTEPVKRKVALKLIKTGMDSKAVVQRFEQERQALALMDHPNIARVLDGGMTPSGQPFFVMELVNGLPLSRFCDDAKLGIRARLELFVPICQAVQHAHQKGIVHRDLKPSNILVTLYDGQPVPKVIDFGVAKATGGKLTDESLSTQFGAVIGTLEYMSPEQAGLSALDIDTRADIYSLGVILYELLTGLKPFDSQRLKKAALDEMVRIIREEDPPRPSTRLSSDASAPSLAAVRQAEPKRLATLMRGELDWVVMKCLEKQRERRYETANGLARDVQRYLADEAVEARPPSAVYRLSKLLRRNKGLATAATLLVFALLAGIAGTTWGMVRAAQRAEGERLAKLDAMAQMEKAELAAKAEQAAKAQAQKRLTQIQKANDLLGSVFENLDPREIARAKQPLQATLVEQLDKAVAQLEGESIGDPLVVAAMQARLGASLLGLGEPGKAVVPLEKARVARQTRLGADHPDTLHTIGGLALAYLETGRPDLALPLLEHTLEVQKAKLGPKHPDTLSSMNLLGGAYRAAGQLKLALPLFEQTLKLRKATLGAEHADTLVSMNNLATAYREAGKLNLALPLYEETLNLMKAKHGLEHPDTLASMNNLAVAYQAGGKLDLALPLFKEALELTRAKLGPEHSLTLTSMNSLAVAYEAAGRLDLALPLYEETLRRREAKFGPDHPNTLSSMKNLGTACCRANQGEKAAAAFRRFAAGRRERAKPDDPEFAGLLAQLSLDLLKCHQHAAAEELLRECLAIREKTQPDAWTTFNTQSLLGAALLGQKNYADAEPLLVKGYESMKAREMTIPPAGNTRIPEALDRLIELYTATNKPAEAKKSRDLRAKYPAEAPNARENN